MILILLIILILILLLIIRKTDTGFTCGDFSAESVNVNLMDCSINSLGIVV